MEKKLLSLKNNRLFFATFFLVGFYFIFGLQMFGLSDNTVPYAHAGNPTSLTNFSASPINNGNGFITFQFTVSSSVTSSQGVYSSFRYVSGVDSGNTCMPTSTAFTAPTTTVNTAVDTYTYSVGSSPDISNTNPNNVQVANIDVTTPNTITIQWNSKADLPSGNGTYCIFAFSGHQGTNSDIATTTVIVDNVTPSVPSALTVNTTSTNSVALGLPSTTSTDSNFSTYKIYYKAGASGVATTDTAFSTSTTPGDTNFDNSNFNNNTTTTITGLTTSTQYVFNIWAYDTYGNSTTAASELTLYTLADTPGVPTVSSVSTSSLTINVDRATNDALSAVTTQYSICKTDNGTSCAANGYASTTDGSVLGASAGWGTYQSWGADNGRSVAGLTPSTSYQFIVQARNADGVETAFSTASTATTTLTAQPVSPTVIAFTTTTLTLSWGDNTNPASVEYRVSGTGITTTSTVVTSSVLLGGLTPNAPYTISVESKNADDTYNVAVTTSLTYTSSTDPTSLTVVSTSTTSMVLQWDTNGSATSTVYEITGNNSFATTHVTSTDTNQTVSTTVSGLIPNTSYTFNIASKNNQDNSYNTASSFSASYTKSATPSDVVATAATSTITVSWNDNGNPSPGTLYNVNITNSDTAYNSTSGETATSTILTGLTPNLSYLISVRASNNDYNTAWATTTLYTLANTAGAPTASSPATTTIALSLNANSNSAATTYAIYNSTSARYLDSAGAATTSPVFQTTSTWSGITAIGLSVDTAYQFTAIARNGDNVNAATSTASTETYTLANAAGTPTATVSSTTALAITINTNSNPANTSYSIYNATSDNYLDTDGTSSVTPVYQTTSTWGGISAVGLTANTAYQFKVTGRNGGAIATAESATSTAVYTLANAAGTPTASSPATTTIDVAIDTNSNPAATTYAIYNSTLGSYLDSAGAATSTPVYQTTSTWDGVTATGLTANTAYQFKTVARNGDDTNAATSSASTALYTLANVPSSVAASASGNDITVTFTGDATSYYVVDNSDSTRYSDYTTTLTRTFSSLTCGTSYTFKVKGKNGDNTETAFSSTASATTANCPAGGSPASTPPSLPASAPSVLAISSPLILTVGQPTSVSVAGVAHTITVSFASASQITLTIQSEPIKLTLNKGESKNIDTNKDTVNDVKITYLGLVSGKPKVEIVNLTDPSEVKSAITINAGAYETDSPSVMIGMNGSDIDQIAISNDANFTNSSYIPYTQSLKWSLPMGNGQKTVYVKFRAKDGGTSIASDTIILNEVGGSMVVTAPTPSIPATTYKFTKTIYPGATGTAVKELQKLLQQLGYYTAKTITGKYDASTKAAVIKFQKAKKLKPYPGWVGPATVKALNALTTISNASPTAVSAVTKATTYKFTKTIYPGATGTAVKELQKLLQQLGYYTAKTITGKYDASTKAAVIKFQKAKKLKPYPGWVGPGTVKALNSL